MATAMPRVGKLRVYPCEAIAVAGVVPYTGIEVFDLAAEFAVVPSLAAGDRTFRILRDAAAWRQAAPSFNGLPVLSGHPVHGADLSDLIVGVTDFDAEFIDPYLHVTLLVWSPAAIAGIESGEQRGLSAGYRRHLDWEPGTTAEGQQYNARSYGITGTHIALCRQSRTGLVVGGDLRPATRRRARPQPEPAHV